jgi:hypothetical protein
MGRLSLQLSRRQLSGFKLVFSARIAAVESGAHNYDLHDADVFGGD